jgi:hypothetical protein
VSWEVKFGFFCLNIILLLYQVAKLYDGKNVCYNDKKASAWLCYHGVRLDSELIGMLSLTVWFLCRVNLLLHWLGMDLL